MKELLHLNTRDQSVSGAQSVADLDIIGELVKELLLLKKEGAVLLQIRQQVEEENQEEALLILD